MERNEIDVCKELGERHGYGHLMSVMSSLWRKKLREEWGEDMLSGAFIPTCLPFIKDEELDHHEKSVETYDRIIENHFNKNKPLDMNLTEKQKKASKEAKKTATLFKQFYKKS